MVVFAQKQEIAGWQETDAVRRFRENVEMMEAARDMFLRFEVPRAVHQRMVDADMARRILPPILDVEIETFDFPALKREFIVPYRASFRMMNAVYEVVAQWLVERRHVRRIQRRRRRALAAARSQFAVSVWHSRYSLGWSRRDDYEHLFFKHYVK